MQYSDLKRFIKIPEIKAERIILRAISRNDLDDVFEYASDEAVSRYLLWSPHETKAVTKRYLSIVESKYKQALFYDWGVVYNGKMIGTCGFSSISVENNSAELGFVLNRSYWGLGIAREAAMSVIRYGFRELALNRIESRYMIENEQSASVMKKCGMSFEGIHRESLLVKGKYRDIGYYAITRKDYFDRVI